MPGSFQTFHYHAGDDAARSSGEASRSAESFLAEEATGAATDAPPQFFTSNEAAARFYLDKLLRQDDRRAMEAVVAPEEPGLVPGLVAESEQDLRVLGTHQLRFAQTSQGIPIFGTSAVVELTDARDLVSVNAHLDQVTGVDPVESLSRAEALDKVAQYTGADIPSEAGVSGRLHFYKDEDSRWHLAWLFHGLPAEPPAADGTTDAEDENLHGLGRRPVPPRVTYLVDAHDGEVLFHYSAVPTAIPARCKGIDEDETEQKFYGQLVDQADTKCWLNDPLRSSGTYDLDFADIFDNPPLPAHPVQADSSDFSTTNRAAVSAHVNATRVLDFYKSVLQRDGLDDQGMAIKSVVNVTARSMETPPTLLNAFWFDNAMWYGQVQGDGRLVSLSRYLDVIGHELTHGVIEHTSNLVYATQSGALNESFADIAGVIINNWYTAPDRHDVGTWDWEIGRGLRRDGRPLRDFEDPSRTGHPMHMNDFRHLSPGELPNNGNDQGWVHFNSSIHNKAVHNLLTMTDREARVFSVEDVAVLTYFGMARLSSLATFSEALQSILDVARTYFGGDTDRQNKLDAIRLGYQSVGIDTI
ncbi:M4 family metallopeptidase [Kocuria sabuli]|uniref:M4 family metallopeptidase n=1 Tax=Kocuria sabuli TaxID=3071448 RepID=UPI0034D3B7DF